MYILYLLVYINTVLFAAANMFDENSVDAICATTISVGLSCGVSPVGVSVENSAVFLSRPASADAE
jgi:hypothetical protein